MENDTMSMTSLDNIALYLLKYSLVVILGFYIIFDRKGDIQYENFYELVCCSAACRIFSHT